MATVRATAHGVLLLLVAVARVTAVAGALAPGSAGALCCSHSKDNQMCRDVCEQIFSSKSESRLKHLLQRAPDYCPETMVEIWSCMNSSLPGVFKKSDGWVGLGCCELAITLECRQACKQASSKNDISKVCRKEYEPVLRCLSVLPSLLWISALPYKSACVCGRSGQERSVLHFSTLALDELDASLGTENFMLTLKIS